MEGDWDIVEFGVGVGLLSRGGVVIEGMDGLNAKLLGGDSKNAASGSGINQGAGLFLVDGVFELFKAEASGEVTTGTET